MSDVAGRCPDIRIALALVAAVLSLSQTAACRSRNQHKSAPAPRDAGEAVRVEPMVGAAAAAPGSPKDTGKFGLGEEREAELRFARCPLSGAAALDPERLLAQAEASHAAGEFDEAYACADHAADLVPESVEAHHLRAAALASLGYYEAAQVAFAMALALDPDDPETLAAAAHFYINVMPPKRRDNTIVGLEYARRGSDRAASRRGSDRGLRATLALLEGQALNDLGRSDQALPRVQEALALAPESIEATHERGVALFDLCRIDEARADFLRVLSSAPDDPYAHYYLGLIYERAGKNADADAHFARAQKLSKGEIAPAVMFTPEEFSAEVGKAVAALPEDAQESLKGVTVNVEDLPATEDLVAGEPPFAPTILGLFRGPPEGCKVEGDPAPERAIILYRKNLARAVRSRDELVLQIRRTLLHEIGHLRGFDEDELRRRGLD